MNDYYLYHHGIKGQKWGVRRYQNDDGTLTEAGKRRYSKQYESHMNKYLSDLQRHSTKLRVDAYNKTADDYNNYKIAEFNKRHKPEDSDYEESYFKQFNSDLEKAYNQAVYDYASSNKHYQKGKAIADKYDLYSVNDLAAEQKRFIDGVDEYKRK